MSTPSNEQRAHDIAIAMLESIAKSETAEFVVKEYLKLYNECLQSLQQANEQHQGVDFGAQF